MESVNRQKRMLFIINPVAGRRPAQQQIQYAIERFTANGYSVRTELTRKCGDAREITLHYGGEYDLVACMGGDGTLSETVGGIILGGHEVPLGYIPAGSTNVFAKQHGITGGVQGAVEIILSGQRKKIDTGWIDGQPFTYIAAFGAFSWVSYATPQPLKNALGHSAYILYTARELPMLKSYHLRFEADGKTYEGNYIFGAVCNVGSISSLLKLPASEVCTDDGLFEILLVHKPTSMPELLAIPGVALSADYSSSVCDFFHARSLTVTAENEMDWTLDGEYYHSGRIIEITCNPQSVELLVKKK